MAYEPKTWADGAAGGTPITAAELNRIESGIDEAHEDLATIPEPLTIGTTASTAAAGNHSHNAADVGAAPASHTHVITDVTGLQGILDDLTSRLEAVENAE